MSRPLALTDINLHNNKIQVPADFDISRFKPGGGSGEGSALITTHAFLKMKLFKREKIGPCICLCILYLVIRLGKNIGLTFDEKPSAMK